MNNELVAAETEAVIRARRVARDARLWEQARGKLDGTSALWLVIICAAILGYTAWARPSVEACVGAMLLLAAAGWQERRTSRRLDAMLELFENSGRSSAP